MASHHHPISFHDRYAQAVIDGHHQKLIRPGGPWEGELPSPRPPSDQPKAGPVNVGIIGAGAAGLYAALIIDSFKDSRITYDILEANPMKTRKGGGRLFTHYFTPLDRAPYDYFDVGAMRFPDIPFMKPVFQLIRDNPKSPIANKLKLLPYYLSDPSGNDLNFYNGIILTDNQVKSDPSPDPFRTGADPPAKYDQMVTNAIGKFKDALKANFVTGWTELMKYDGWSTRDYAALSPQGPKYKDRWINFMETFDSATNLYDCALSESVMDSLDFDYADGVEWWCIDGGTGLIADAMTGALSKKPQYGSRVTAMALVGGDTPISVNVTVSGKAGPLNYSHVISTLPFGCLRMVDTTHLNFDWDTQTAIRALHYDCSVKVAIKFSTRWWEDPGLPKGAHFGGGSSTDRPTRVVVYPSYGMHQNQDATMIVSYTWAQDALRLGALAKGKETEEEKLLIQLILKDLADIHQIGIGKLSSIMVDYKVHDWYADEYSVGAFALFGPGNFSNLYPKVTQPVGGLFHFAGEATSVHHAWVLGAFNSAYRSILEILVHEGWKDLEDLLVEKWGPSDEINYLQLTRQVALGQYMFDLGRK